MTFLKPAAGNFKFGIEVRQLHVSLWLSEQQRCSGLRSGSNFSKKVAGIREFMHHSEG